MCLLLYKFIYQQLYRNNTLTHHQQQQQQQTSTERGIRAQEKKEEKKIEFNFTKMKNDYSAINSGIWNIHPAFFFQYYPLSILHVIIIGNPLFMKGNIVYT